MSEMKVIGYFAFASRRQVVCTDVDACVVAGSDRAMRDYLMEIAPDDCRRATVRKTRFGEIMQGLSLGAAYAFDEDSYSRFYPLAQAAGLPVEPGDFSAAANGGDRFFTVRLSS